MNSARRSSSRLPPDLSLSSSYIVRHTQRHNPAPDHPYPQRRQIAPPPSQPHTCRHAACRPDDHRPLSAVCAIIWVPNALLLLPAPGRPVTIAPALPIGVSGKPRDLRPAAPRPPIWPIKMLEVRLRAARVAAKRAMPVVVHKLL